VPTLWLLKLCGGYLRQTREGSPKDFFVAKGEPARPVIAQIFGFSRRLTGWDEVRDHLKLGRKVAMENPSPKADYRFPQTIVVFSLIIAVILIGLTP